MSVFKPAALAVMLASAALAHAAGRPTSPFDLMVESGAKAAASSGYNFSGSFKLDNIAMPPAALPVRSQYPATDEGGKQYTQALQAANSARQYSKIGAEMMKALHLDFEGAIDMNALKFEVSPTLRISRRNLDSRLTFPVFIDGNDLSAIVDISAVSWVLGDDFKGTNYIKAHLSSELATKLNVRKLADAMRQIVKTQYAAIDPDSFSFTPLTAAERKEGGLFKVHVRISEQQYAQLAARMLGELSTTLKDGTPAGQPGLAEIAKEVSRSQHAREDLDVVLNKQLQPIAMHADITMRSDEIRMHAEGDIHMSNLGKPQFHLHPPAGEIKDIGPFPPKVAAQQARSVPVKPGAEADIPPAPPANPATVPDVPDAMPLPGVTVTPAAPQQ